VRVLGARGFSVIAAALESRYRAAHEAGDEKADNIIAQAEAFFA